MGIGSVVLAAASPPVIAGYAAGAQARDVRTAARALAMSTDRVVPIGALTTADSTTVANPDGTFTLTTMALPVAGAPAVLATASPCSPCANPNWSPPTKSGGRQHYAQVQSGCPTFTYYDNVSQPGVGYNDFDSCVGIFRSYYQVDTSNLQSNFIIIHSTLKIDEVFSAWDSCGQGSETITVKWTSAIGPGVDWNNKPTIDSRGDPITSKTLKSVGNAAGTMCPGGTVAGDFNMAEAITKVAKGGFDNLTFGLFGDETPGSHSLERFNNNPSILTVYDIPPNPPTMLAASPSPVDSSGVADQGCGSAAAGFMGISSIGGSHIATLTAELTSAITFKATGTSAEMFGAFTLQDDTTGATVGTPKSSGFVTSGGTVTVPTPVLTDGHEYSWSVISDDQYFFSSPSVTCTFIVDLTAPLNPTITSTDFPPSGSLPQSTLHNGQTGQVTLTSSDPNPSSGSASGLRGFAYSLDSPVPNSGATIHPSSGTLTVPVTPVQWGTHILYAEAFDKAGNVSGQSQYSFYVPWSPTARVAPGDISGDGIPDLVTATAGGSLVAFLGNADPAAPPVTLSVPIDSPGGQGTAWNKFLLTHRGSFTNQGVDDLWAYDTVNHNLYLYKNSGANPFENTGNVVNVTKAEVVTDAVNISPTSPDNPINGNPQTACATTSMNSCAGYDNNDWSMVTQVLAPGDLYAGTPKSTFDNGAPGLLTVEGGSLWYYQGQTSPFYIGTAIQLGTSGWDGVTLMAPGTVNGKPTLWARDNSSGAILQFTITFDSSGFPVNLGSPSSGTPLTIPGGTMFKPSIYPSAVSPGDLRGSGFPDLVVTTTAGRVIDYPGAAPTSAGLATFGSPVTLGAAAGIVHDWPLTDGSGTTAADIVGGASATLSTGASWTTDSSRGTVVALNGSSGYLTLPQQMISGGNSLTLTITFKATAGTTGILVSTGQDVPANLNAGAMPVMYIGTDGRLYAQYWTGTVQPIVSPAAVNDGAWHTATLAGAATGQTLFLDGTLIGSQSGTIQDLDPLDFAGAGVFNTSPWINAPGGTSATHASYFSGDLSEIRFYATAQTSG